MRVVLIKAVLVTLLIVFPGSFNVLASQPKETSWPGDTWEISNPEAEGLNAEAIKQLDAEIRSGKHGFIDSMLIARNGRIAYEANYKHDYSKVNAGRKYPSPPPWDYFNTEEYPWRHGTRLHSLQSATKSFMSALMGIAIERGDKAFPMSADFEPKRGDGSTGGGCDLRAPDEFQRVDDLDVVLPLSAMASPERGAPEGGLFEPTVFDLQDRGRSFPPNHLHESWMDFLYWDAVLDA